MESDGSLPSSQEPVTGPYPEARDYSPHYETSTEWDEFKH